MLQRAANGLLGLLHLLTHGSVAVFSSLVISDWLFV